MATERKSGEGVGVVEALPFSLQALRAPTDQRPAHPPATSVAGAVAATAATLRRTPANRLLLRSGLTLGAAIAVLASLLALFGNDPGTTNRILRFVDAVGSDGAAASISGVVGDALSNDVLAALCLLAALAAAAWLASAYSRSLEQFLVSGQPFLSGELFLSPSAVPEEEGNGPRMDPRPGAFAISVAVAVALLFAAVAVALVLTGPAARAAVEALGGGGHALTLWNAGKWPLIGGAYVVLFVLLYRAVTTARSPRVRSSAGGQAIAGVLWALVLAGFTFYLANFGSIDETYGSLGATVVSLMWLILFSVLYYATPSLKVERFGAVVPGLVLSLAGWLAISAGFAVAASLIDPFSTTSGALTLVAIVLTWLWLTNLLILFGVKLNLELGRRHQAIAEAPVPAVPPPAAELERMVRIALTDDAAHRGMWSALPGRPEEVPALLTEVECDLNDWGFAYGVAWAIARRKYPEESDRLVAKRALEAARTVFGEYCAGDEWSERLAQRELLREVSNRL